MSVSVIIPHYGEQRLTLRCLDAVETTAPTVEMVVVDNDHTLDPNGLPDTYIKNPCNRGFAVACNQGALAATGDILVFLNNDTVPQVGWLDPLVALAKIGHLAGGLLKYPDGRTQHAGVRLFRDGNGVLTAANLLEDGSQRRVDAVTGACLAVHRQVFAHCGGFDTGYWNGYEDVDLCLTARALGYECWYEPASVVVHEESAGGPERWSRVRENVARLQAKWGETYEGLK